MKAARLAVLLLIILMFSACSPNVKNTADAEESQNSEGQTTETIQRAAPPSIVKDTPKQNAFKLKLARSKSKVFGPGDDDFELSVETMDMNSDARPDTVTIVSIPPNKERFQIAVQLSDNSIVSQDFEGSIWSESTFYFVDITGDSVPEIVFPDFYYSSTADENFSAIYQIENNSIIEIPLSNGHEQGDNDHKWDVGKLEMRTINSFEYEIFNQLSARAYQIDINDYRTGQSEFEGLGKENISILTTDQYILSCWLVEIANEQYGFRLNRFLELYLTTENTHDTEPSATIVVSSLVKWNGQNWELVDEAAYSVENYYLESELYWNPLR